MAFLIILKTYTDLPIDNLVVMGAFFGSFLPDADIKGSKASIIPVYLIARHRGSMHSIFILFALSALVGFFSISLGAGLCFGYGLHLLADLTTPMKLPYWNFPFHNKKVIRWQKR